MRRTKPQPGPFTVKARHVPNVSRLTCCLWKSDGTLVAPRRGGNNRASPNKLVSSISARFPSPPVAHLNFDYTPRRFGWRVARPERSEKRLLVLPEQKMWWRIRWRYTSSYIFLIPSFSFVSLWPLPSALFAVDHNTVHLVREAFSPQTSIVSGKVHTAEGIDLKCKCCLYELSRRSH